MIFEIQIGLIHNKEYNMICKLLSLPVKLVSAFISLITGIFKILFSLGYGTFRLIFNHMLGTVFGALIGLVLGHKHIGIKLFSHKKRIIKKKS